MSRESGPVIEVFADIWCPLPTSDEDGPRQRARDWSHQPPVIWVRAWPTRAGERRAS